MDFFFGYIVSLLVVLGNGDVGNIIRDVRRHPRTRTIAEFTVSIKENVCFAG